MTKEHLNDFPMIRPVPYMGVIWVNHKAAQLGYVSGDPNWFNLGQGQPEEGELVGAPERLHHLELDPQDYAYGPCGGLFQLRKAVADMLNRLYRKGKKSQYGPENVTVAAGGRIALTRLMSILSRDANVLIRNPDYTAYEDLLNYQLEHIQFYCENTTEESAFSITPERLRTLTKEKGVNTFLFSNPCNPSGAVIEGEELKEYCKVAREEGLLLTIDEFYSHYLYEDGEKEGLSAARYVEDVERDPVVLIDGLTKNQRYPGFRISWIVGPSRVIEAINRAASAIDGGASVTMQRLAVEALEPKRFEAETHAVRKTFQTKRDYVLERLKRMGIRVAIPPKGTFYIWADISDLPNTINNCDAFCLEALNYHVLTVPGRFFDIRPDRTRPEIEPFEHWMRFSFGPKLSILEKGLDRIEAMIKAHRALGEGRLKKTA